MDETDRKSYKRYKFWPWRNPLSTEATVQRLWGIDLGSRNVDGWPEGAGPKSGEGYEQAKHEGDSDGVPWELR